MEWIGGLLIVLAVVVLVVFGRSPKEVPAKTSTRPPPDPEPQKPSEPKPAEPKPVEAKKADTAKKAAPMEDVDEDITMVGKIDLATLTAARRSDRPTAPPPPQADVEVDVDEPPASDPTGPQALILVTGVAHTDTGKLRKRNEDSFLTLEQHSLYVVADGMGGYAGGALASGTTVDTIKRAFDTGEFEGEPMAARPRRGDELVRAIEMANRAVFAKASEDPELAGMGTTVVAARFAQNKRRVYICHVGDSRCYRLRGGVLEQVTRDHTIGAVTGATGRLAAQLTRAVGIAETVDVDLLSDDPRVGDTYLICSDGLTKMVSDAEITALASGDDLDAAARGLVAAANEHGGRDNVTVILARVAAPKALLGGRSAPRPGDSQAVER
jgi:protein phosphatase